MLSVVPKHKVDGIKALGGEILEQCPSAAKCVKRDFHMLELGQIITETTPGRRPTINNALNVFGNYHTRY